MSWLRAIVRGVCWRHACIMLYAAISSSDSSSRTSPHCWTDLNSNPRSSESIGCHRINIAKEFEEVIFAITPTLQHEFNSRWMFCSIFLRPRFSASVSISLQLPHMHEVGTGSSLEILRISFGSCLEIMNPRPDPDRLHLSNLQQNSVFSGYGRWIVVLYVERNYYTHILPDRGVGAGGSKWNINNRPYLRDKMNF